MRHGLDSMPYLEFFDRHGEPNDRLLAHYLLGRAYHEQGEAPMALQCYQQAIECADTTASDCDFAQLSRVYAQMGQVFYYQRLVHQQLPIINKAIEYALIAKDTLTAMSYYWQKYNIYEEADSPSIAISIIDTLALWYKNQDKIQLYARAKGRSVYLLLHTNEYIKAKEYMNIYEQLSGLFDNEGNIETGREIYYYYKGLYFLNINVDSAEFFFRKELNTGKDFNNQNGGALGLAMVYEQRHQSDSAAKYYQYAYAMNDSMYAQMTTSEVERMQAMYDYTRLQEVARQKTEEARTEKINRQIAVGIILVIVLFFGLITFYLIRKEKKGLDNYRKALKELKSVRSEKDFLKHHESEYEQLISNKEKRIAELEKFISKYGKQLYFTTANAERCLYESITYKRIEGFAVRGQKLTEEDWKDISILITEYFPGFDDFLMTYKPQLKSNEYPICILLRLHFKATDIAGMLNLSKSQVSQLCSDILYKLFRKKGSSKELSARLVKIF